MKQFCADTSAHSWMWSISSDEQTVTCPACGTNTDRKWAVAVVRRLERNGSVVGHKPARKKAKPLRSTPKNLTREARKTALERMAAFVQKHGGRCYFCRREVRVTLAVYDNLRATREHLIPVSRSGGNKGNTVLACHRCNSDKANQTVEEWVERWYQWSPGTTEERQARKGLTC